MSTLDEPNIDGEFLKHCEVEVKLDEIEMIEENFKRVYWPWELPTAFRKQMTVCNIHTYIHTYIHIRMYM